ncbi:Aldo/keto reductase [Periconia macrospinosa]|uniref:Aldo/keto reductase n=1 Tax=Periconia macrospinosa TaxID=97972 RepID=A0A2V1DUI6_9PLEO|nr:Aldo/keto reductase [Periconia macrospinosa]
MPIDLVIGAGHWGQGGQNDETQLIAAIRKYKSVIKTVDTAALYPFAAPGSSEKVVGDAGFGNDGYLVNTKALFYPQGGCYTPDGVQSSVARSLESLNMANVHVLYAHAPDQKTPISEQAAAFNDAFRKGHCKSVGVANLDAEMLQEWISAAQANGYVKPTIYQGHYNLLCRAHEETIFPLIRQNGMKYMAYSPIAGGFLSGIPTFSSSSELAGTRFEATDNNVKHGPFYRFWYNKESMHTAVRTLKTNADRHGLSLPTIAIRWLLHHSALQDGDGIIIGPETVDELDECIQAYNAGPLPDDLVMVIESLQGFLKEDAKTIVHF